MILRTPIDQAAAARGAHASRTRRAATRCRARCAENKLRREINQLCAENDMAAPFPDAYFARNIDRPQPVPPKRKGETKTLWHMVRAWL